MAIVIERAGFDEFLTSEQKIQALLLGKPGVGKTPWAAQAPKPLFIAVDTTARPSLAITQTPLIDAKSPKEVKDALQYVVQEQSRPSFLEDYQTIVLDTISVLQQRMVSQSEARNGGELNWKEVAAEFGAIMDLLAKINNLNVIVLCHTDERFGVKAEELDPMLSGSKMKTLMLGMFPFIGWAHLDWENVENPIEPKFDKYGKELPTTAALGGYSAKGDLVRKIEWRATPNFPILRSPANILDTTPITMTPRDWTSLQDAFKAGSKQYEDRAEGSVVAEVGPITPAAAPAGPDVDGGPVDPKLPSAQALPKVPDPVAAVQGVLGGEVVEAHPAEGVSKVEFLAESIARAGSVEELRSLWADNQGDWTEELTGLASKRTAELKSN